MTFKLLPLLALLGVCPLFAATAVIPDQTNYNAGSKIMVRLQGGGAGEASVRYAGEDRPLVSGVAIEGSEYQLLWTIPSSAQTGRYEIDWKSKGGKRESSVGTFAVHRQLAKVRTFDLDKTFYTAGDAVNPHIVVQNISDRSLEHLQVEFEAYTYPWIAPAADEPPAWKTLAAKSLVLGPGETKDFHLQNAATLQAHAGDQTYAYFSAVIRDSEHPDHIYDLAFALPAIIAPSKREAPKGYPFLYLYPRLRDLPTSEAYRQFYPPAYVSEAIRFDEGHTMFPAGQKFRLAVELKQAGVGQFRLFDANKRVLQQGALEGNRTDWHQLSIDALQPGVYTLEVRTVTAQGVPTASRRLDIAVNRLPKSILLFCAHEDDDTAHPEMIRAAVENNIPIHVVYYTSGDAGGCDRYFMHSCDAPRAMDFGEVRMDEARASLEHLGVPRENLFFLGLPDGGMEQIWLRNLHREQPYLSVLLASEHSPYADSAIPNLPYSRDAVLEATEQFIRKYQPELIITGHPDERHVDHRTNNWLVVKAMQKLLREGAISSNTELVVDASYGPGPQKHAPYRYEKLEFYTSGPAAVRGQEAAWYYQSQDGNHQQADIMTYDKLRLSAPDPHFGIYRWPYPHYRILDWQKHEGWNE